MVTRQEELAILDGSAEELPEISSKLIRVFISSTFSDMTLERNALMERVYTRLKDYCRQNYGLEFQAVDMRWGVHEDAENEHMITALCMKEIDNCMKLSSGPKFLVLVGQKYGYRPIPTSIVLVEFEQLRAALLHAGVDCSLLDVWYKLDENALPARYVLQTIDSIIPAYGSKDEQEKRKGKQAWQSIFENLQNVLRVAADKCYKDGEFTDDVRNTYFVSVTEREILHALLDSPPVVLQNGCLCFFRTISDLHEITDVKTMRRLLDVSSSNERTDSEVQMLEEKLREKLKNLIPKDNIQCYTVKSTEMDCDGDDEYLSNFCRDIYNKLVQLIDRSVSQKSLLHDDQLLTEVIQHSKTQNRLTEIFLGRDDALSAIEEYVTGDSHEVFVVYGVSGSGKSSLMAQASSLCKTWRVNDKRCRVLTRFLGTTPNSSSIHPLLQSLCLQTCALYGNRPEELPSDMLQLTALFHGLLEISEHGEPLILFLDAVDQLTSAQHAFKLLWLPKELRRNVKIIVSTINDAIEILATLRTHISAEHNFLEVSSLPEEASLEVALQCLQKRKRTVTTVQRDLIQELFRICSLPLYAKVMLDEFAMWKSYSTLSFDVLAKSAESAVSKMLERLENQHGKVLVSHTLGYITAARHGLSGVEIEDILSLDDQVLNEVFMFWIPPIRRVPPSIVTHLKLDLQSYLVEREADGTIVTNWYHRKFAEVARQRYLSDAKLKRNLHSNLADYFIGVWGGGREKRFQYNQQLLSRLSCYIKASDSTADRHVPLQPLSFTSHADSRDVLRFNLRKLSELPLHLKESNRSEELKSLVALSYSWMYAKIRAFSVQDLLMDINLAADIDPDNIAIIVIANTLRVCASSLNINAEILPFEISGRLLIYYDTNSDLRRLIQEAESVGLQQSCLVPMFPSLDCPSEGLMFCLEAHKDTVSSVILANNDSELISISCDNTICHWDLVSGELLKQVDLKYKQEIRPSTNAFLSGDEKFLILPQYQGTKQIGVYDKESGELLSLDPFSHNLCHRTSIGRKLMCIDCSIIEIESSTKVCSVFDFAHFTDYVCLRLTLDDQLLFIGLPRETCMYRICDKQKLLSIPADNIASCILTNSASTRTYIGYAQTCKIKCYNTDSHSHAFGEKLLTLSLEKLSPSRIFDLPHILVNEVSEMLLSKDEDLLLTIIKRIYIVVWNLKSISESVLMTVPLRPGEKQYFYGASLTKNNEHVMAIELNSNLYIWNAKNGELVLSHVAHNNEIHRLLFCHRYNAAVTIAKGEPVIKVWSIDKLHSTPVKCKPAVYENPVNDILISKQWEANTAIIRYTFPQKNSKTYHHLDYFGLDLWNITHEERYCIIPFGQYGSIHQMKVSDDGSILAFSLGIFPRRQLRVVDLSNSKLLLTRSHPFCQNIELSNRGDYVAVATDDAGDCCVALHSMLQKTKSTQYHDCCDMRFTADGERLVLLTTNRKIRCLILKTMKVSAKNLDAETEGGNIQVIPSIEKLLVTTKDSCDNNTVRCLIVNTTNLNTDGVLTGIVKPGILDISQDAVHGVDGSLNVYSFQMFKLVRKLQTGCTVKGGMARFIHNNRFIVWVDGQTVDLLKLCEISTDTLFACVNVHCSPLCLEVSHISGIVCLGANNGHLHSFSVQCDKLPEVDDEVLSNIDERTKGLVKCSDTKPDIKLVLSCNSGPSVHEITVDLQEELIRLTKEDLIHKLEISINSKQSKKLSISCCVI